MVDNGLKDLYIGETSNHQKNGFGVYKFQNRFYRYEGNWKDGKKHGHGMLIMADGSYYEGVFTDGEITGTGTKYNAIQRSEYSGDFLNGEYNGNGIIKYAKGGKYEGSWQRNQYHGMGCLTYPNGELYEGEFHCHKRHGHGQMKYKNGDFYDGDWIRDKRQGQGCLESADGSVYEGQFFNDMYHGQGRMAHSSGIVYDGLWSSHAPVNRASRVIISNHLLGSLQLTQGEPFSLEVEILSEDGQVMTVESGRQVRVFAGFQDHRPANGSSIFHQIEDIAEEAVQTPFGYQVVEFPLSDFAAYQAFLEAEATATAASATGAPSQAMQQASPPHSEETPPVESAAARPLQAESVANLAAGGQSANNLTLAAPTQVGDDFASAVAFRADSPPPPGVPNAATVDGRVSFTGLVLPRPHSLYRPYAVLDEREGSTSPKATPAAGAAAAKKKKGKDRDDDSRLRQRRLGDERFARPGEYVLCVADVSEPPFPPGSARRPEPAFLRMVLTAVPQVKESQNQAKEKEKKKQWNTQAMIASAVAQSSTQQATGDLERLRGEASS